MSAPTTALGLRMPRRAVTRTAVRVVLYALVLFVFVMPLWTMLATVLSGTPLKTGQMSLFPAHFTLANIRAAFRFGVGRGLLNSVVVTGVGLFLQVTVSALAAYALARKKFRGQALVLLAVLATMMMPEEVIAIPLYLVLGKVPDPLGGGDLLNSYSGLILPVVGWALPIYVLTGFMKTIPLELEEAARVDGAKDLRIFFQIILPLCRPALGTCAVFGFLMIWDQYLLPLLVAQTPHMYTMTLVVTSLSSSQEQSQGVRMAASLMLMIPSVLVYLGLQRLFERGMPAGSLKG
ncbi:carbohydrate ABC transporter membrane protein 2, CUT1 family [Streptomyces sp. DvalAA-14]|uniref:carbohydrate ABC transporter permease n=1 Tax=unclassified Streptomyces TaxID=2593676 RepID=UPI00081B4698|nr:MULTISPECIES: carbohydrate ABC transporter permease [unclassified Streptomyces]MYS21371.1 ABC transporter permease subunit [Streptomyces sp. SID4948]SCD90891.1 carbohydrate ABC transporter membrane protein 2, CUT1 family [Streptomyces sp. DvalAA-14]